ncbi:MAG TPA: acyltransferase, partial [Herpetosiphonaceae bacterium]
MSTLRRAGWRRFGRASLFWLPLALISLALAGLAAWPAGGVLPGSRLPAGPGFHNIEQDGLGQSFRWTDGRAAAPIPPAAKPALIEALLAVPPESAPAAISLDQRPLARQTAAGLRRYLIFAPASFGRRDLHLASGAFRVPGDVRDHGVMVFALDWRGSPAPGLRALAGWLLALGGGCWLLAAFLSRERIGAWLAQPIAGQAPAATAGGRPHLPGIDGLRGLAILMVVVGHTWVHTSRPDIGVPAWVFNLGGLGVHLFLVLSGFCLAYPLVGGGGIDQPPLRAFARRRLLRIVPPYYAAIILFSALAWLSALRPGFATTFVTPDLALALKHALFVRNYADPRTLNGTFWSLELEVHLYILFPVLIWLARRYGVAHMLVAACGVTLGWRLAVAYAWTPGPTSYRAGQLLRITVFSRLAEFALGIAAAVVAARRPWRVSGRMSLLLALGLCGLALSMPRPAAAIWFDALIGAGMFWLVLGAAQAPLDRLFGAPALRWVGIISFSVFLTHQPVLGELYAWLPERAGWA